MLHLERVPDQVGYLVLTEDGAVVASGGELENNERVANVITGLVSLTSCVDPAAFPADEAFKRISVTYEDHSYVVCLSNKRLLVVKRRCVQSRPDAAVA
ncbi:ragulator complex protein LAMTOR4 homolog [Bacillus rossius redtenbacheri]|uniref:ragulator complex protein LAMTOR4 homolog n=1 Tax=Bacillus rossius redtenbacheri TaxID=93214 RepID=UPI002FDE5AFA